MGIFDDAVKWVGDHAGDAAEGAANIGTGGAYGAGKAIADGDPEGAGTAIVSGGGAPAAEAGAHAVGGDSAKEAVHQFHKATFDVATGGTFHAAESVAHGDFTDAAASVTTVGTTAAAEDAAQAIGGDHAMKTIHDDVAAPVGIVGTAGTVQAAEKVVDGKPLVDAIGTATPVGVTAESAVALDPAPDKDHATDTAHALEHLAGTIATGGTVNAGQELVDGKPVVDAVGAATPGVGGEAETWRAMGDIGVINKNLANTEADSAEHISGTIATGGSLAAADKLGSGQPVVDAVGAATPVVGVVTETARALDPHDPIVNEVTDGIQHFVGTVTTGGTLTAADKLGQGDLTGAAGAAAPVVGADFEAIRAVEPHDSSPVADAIEHVAGAIALGGAQTVVTKAADGDLTGAAGAATPVVGLVTGTIRAVDPQGTTTTRVMDEVEDHLGVVNSLGLLAHPAHGSSEATGTTGSALTPGHPVSRTDLHAWEANRQILLHPENYLKADASQSNSADDATHSVRTVHDALQPLGTGHHTGPTDAVMAATSVDHPSESHYPPGLSHTGPAAHEMHLHTPTHEAAVEHGHTDFHHDPH